MRKLYKTQTILLICARSQAENKCPRITKPDDFVKDAVSIPSESCDLLYRFSKGFLQSKNILFDLYILPPDRSRFQKVRNLPSSGASIIVFISQHSCAIYIHFAFAKDHASHHPYSRPAFHALARESLKCESQSFV